jgi:two-component system nitrate/nitrite response regulator NarL
LHRSVRLYSATERLDFFLHKYKNLRSVALRNERMNAHIRVAIVHRNRLFGESLAYALSQDRSLSLCCHVDGLENVPKDWGQPIPDVLLVELTDATRATLVQVSNLRLELPGCRIIMLEVPECEETVLACIEIAGATGYVTANGSLEDVFRAIRSTMSGETLCPPRVANLVFSRVSELSRQISTTYLQSSKALTRREQAIVSAIEKGLSNKEIAVQLGIEVSTVKNHVHNILDKLKQHDRQSAVRYVRQHGLGAPTR